MNCWVAGPLYTDPPSVHVKKGITILYQASFNLKNVDIIHQKTAPFEHISTSRRARQYYAHNIVELNSAV